MLARTSLEERDIPVRWRNKSSQVTTAGSTYDQTKQLLQQGMTIEEVAQHRGLAKSTIAGHLERVIQSGSKMDLAPLMPPQERFDAIRAAFVESGGTFLSPVKEILGDDYSYDEIRLVWLYLDQEGERRDSPVGKK